MNLYLIANGYPPIVLKATKREKYYRCLRAADSGHPARFIHLIAKAVDESLTLYLSIHGGVDELIPLGVLAQESKYSQEYLSLRARQGLLDAVKVGRTWHATKNAIRDTCLNMQMHNDWFIR